jgi:hypothetical protein
MAFIEKWNWLCKSKINHFDKSILAYRGRSEGGEKDREGECEEGEPMIIFSGFKSL